jgi:hypothetical protein
MAAQVSHAGSKNSTMWTFASGGPSRGECSEATNGALRAAVSLAVALLMK